MVVFSKNVAAYPFFIAGADVVVVAQLEEERVVLFGLRIFLKLAVGDGNCFAGVTLIDERRGEAG